MVKWEYKHVRIRCSFDELEEILNNWGEDGWELCQAQPDSFYVIFKRPIEAMTGLKFDGS